MWRHLRCILKHTQSWRSKSNLALHFSGDCQIQKLKPIMKWIIPRWGLQTNSYSWNRGRQYFKRSYSSGPGSFRKWQNFQQFIRTYSPCLMRCAGTPRSPDRTVWYLCSTLINIFILCLPNFIHISSVSLFVSQLNSKLRILSIKLIMLLK